METISGAVPQIRPSYPGRVRLSRAGQERGTAALISERYEKKATIITSNKSLKEWGKVLGDSSLASAIVDRTMHHGDVYYLSGESYRLRGKNKKKPNKKGGDDS